MIRVNAMFSRKVDGRIESRSVTNIELNCKWGAPEMRELIREHRPEGNGWSLSAYAQRSDKPE